MLGYSHRSTYFMVNNIAIILSYNLYWDIEYNIVILYLVLF